MLSNVEDLFDRFKMLGLNLVEQAVSEGWVENEVLDFKLAADGTAPMRPDDRKNLGEALSGFANADGGILLWGVRADKQLSDEPDTAKELKPIKKLRHFVGDLQSHTSQVVSPGLVGVEHHEIRIAEGIDEGYVVSYIPKGDGEPRMAVAKDQHRFYVRAGSSFIKMSPSMIADRYSKRPQPKLEFFWRFTGKDEHYFGFDTRSNDFTVIFTIGVRNTGRGIARFPALKIKHNERLSRYQPGLDGNGRSGLPQVPTESVRGFGYTSFYAGGADVVIYPGTEHAVTKLLTTFKNEQPATDLAFPFEIHCDGFSTTGEALIPGSEIVTLRGY